MGGGDGAWRRFHMDRPVRRFESLPMEAPAALAIRCAHKTMRAVRAAFDPRGRMNPGTVLGA